MSLGYHYDFNMNSLYLITLWYNGFRGMGDIDGNSVCKALNDQDMYSGVLICKMENFLKHF